ncbi:MAG: DinB family protein [Dinghuibacter sp.]|nr:DinB family protein [Dinghuibacter sp.]
MKVHELPYQPEYFSRYYHLLDDVPLLEVLQKSIDELDELPMDQFEALGNRVYAPGKWTVKDIIQHLSDINRTFTYRALAFARADSQQMPSIPEDDYAITAQANARSLVSLVNELRIVNQSLKALFESFTPEMLVREGIGFKGPYTVASIGFTLPGHQRWHFDVLKERYFPLLEQQ